MLENRSKAQRILEAVNKPLKKLSILLRIRKTNERLPKFKKINPALFKPISPEAEKKYIEYWSRLYKKVNLSYIRLYKNFSGIEDHRYVPNDIYCAIIDRTLNHFDYSYFESNKNYYERFLDKDLFPKTFLRKDLGQYIDRNYGFLSKEEADIILKNIGQDFIIKATTGSSAKNGASVKLFKYGEKITLKALDEIYKDNYIIQEAVKQHEFFAKMHQDSLNTMRIIAYRSVKDNKINIIKVALKIGTNHSHLDNANAGGIFNNISPDGGLSDYSVSMLTEKHYEHPISKIKFKNLVIPHFQHILDEIKKTASKITSQRILGFDVTLNSENEVKIIEINIMGGAAGFWQMQGGPLLGEFTDEIVEYCIKNMKNNNFQHLRI